MPVKTTIQTRRDTAANWTTTNPVLAAGEMGLETDTRKTKFGDGTTAWASLAYATSAGLTVSDSAPSSPSAGAQWFNSSTGKTYIYYTDANSSQWIELDSNGTSATSTGNAIINGAFDWWQRAASQTAPSFTNPASGTYTADRWFMYYDGSGGTRTISRQAFTPGDAPIPVPYFFRWSQTVAGSGATINAMFSKSVEDVSNFAGQTVTFSFYAKAAANASLVMQIYQEFGTGGSSAVLAAYPTFNLTTSWQRFTHSFTMPSISGKTIGTGSSISFIANFPVNATGTYDMTGLQLEAGSTATSFKRNAPSIQAELAACQRYYYRIAPGVQYAPVAAGGIGNGATNTNARFVVKHPVTMRVVPTSVEFSNLSSADTVSLFTATSVSQVYGGLDYSAIDVVNSGTLTAYRPYSLVANATSGYLGLNAEL